MQQNITLTIFLSLFLLCSKSLSQPIHSDSILPHESLFKFLRQDILFIKSELKKDFGIKQFNVEIISEDTILISTKKELKGILFDMYLINYHCDLIIIYYKDINFESIIRIMKKKYLDTTLLTEEEIEITNDYILLRTFEDPGEHISIILFKDKGNNDMTQVYIRSLF